MYLLMLLLSVWWWRYLGSEFNDMVYVLGYMVKLMICSFLTLDHDHESVHVCSAEPQLVNIFLVTGFIPVVASIHELRTSSRVSAINTQLLLFSRTS
jgi:hypothetical protein